MIRALLLATGLLLCGVCRSERAHEQLSFGRFGEISIYRPSGTPRDVVLFLSGDNGWNLGVISMAQHLADRGAIVAGIDIRHYREQLEASADACVSPSADFENLSRYLQSKFRLKDYLQPTLVGYSSGATLAYATLAQATAGVFKGALSLAFCPDLDLKKPLCKGSGIAATPRRSADGTLQGMDFLPAKTLAGKWISLQGETDQLCPAHATQKFIEAVAGGEIILLPKVGHDYSVEKNWLPQYAAAYARITEKTAAVAASLADLPLTLVSAKAGSSSPWFGIFLSGDGGWVGLDRGVSKELAKHGIPVVGWDSLKYFWSPRTPAGIAGDLDRVIQHYAAAWDKTRVLLVGYSQGADTLPFMVNRLPAADHDRVGLTALVGLSDNAVFEFHVAQWLGSAERGIPTGPELERWSGAPYVCIYGVDDHDAACEQLAGHDGSVVKMSGGHHFGGRYSQIAQEIFSRLPTL